MWFHLSDTKWQKNAITELRQTQCGFGEPEVPRFSVAPTVGRAYLACPHARKAKNIFIYEVQVKDPVPTTDTADYELSHEHLITNAVLSKEGGAIPVRLVGQLQMSPDERLFLMILLKHKNQGMSYEEEQQVLWEVDDGVWRVRNPNQSEVAQMLDELRREKVL